jgi:hypothetical protein
MSEQARLERRYRRLLACYPRAFRRENEEEILAVLLACAQEGQQRPGLAASADMIKGAVQVWLRPAPGQPHSVRIAIRLVCAGAVAQLATMLMIVATTGSVRSAVARRYPGLAAAQHDVNAMLVVHYAGAALGVVLCLVATRALMRGRDWARIAVLADFGWITLNMLFMILQGGAVYAPADMIAGAVEWLIFLSACGLLFTATSGRFYQPEPRAVTAWRGTFGSM